MKKVLSVVLMLFVILFAFQIAFVQGEKQQNKKEKQQTIRPEHLAGVWEGPAETPEGTDVITCNFIYKESKISGFLTDEFGYFYKTPISKVKLEKNTLSFESVVATPDGNMPVLMKAVVQEDTLKGYWELIETGETGNWKAVKEKEKR